MKVYKLGCKTPAHEPRLLKLARYMERLPDPPDEMAWSAYVESPWGMMGNDQAGDCTIAAAGHLEMVFSFNALDPFIPSTEQVIADYSKLSGYDPATGDNDNGLDPLKVFKHWRKHGFFDGESKIGGFGFIDPTNTLRIKQAVELFGGVYLAVAMPEAWQGRDQWEIPPGGLHGNGLPGGWGGHAVPAARYDPERLWPITWGAEIPCTWEAVAAYAMLVLVPVGMSFFEESGKTPLGFDMARMKHDLEAVTA